MYIRLSATVLRIALPFSFFSSQARHWCTNELNEIGKVSPALRHLQAPTLAILPPT